MLEELKEKINYKLEYARGDLRSSSLCIWASWKIAAFLQVLDWIEEIEDEQKNKNLPDNLK